MRKILLFLVSILLFLSCVPSKDLIYLSGTPIENKEIHKLNTNPYKLQVGDNISIDVTSDNANLVAVFLKSSNSLSENTSTPIIYSIDVNGTIRMPILGELNVLGYTTKEVRVKIEEKFANYFMKEDSYFVSVKLDGIKYTIMGEINSPGPKVVYQNQLSILDAITFSGDIPISGDKKNVEVIRISPNGNKKVTIDLTTIDALNSEIFFIQNKVHNLLNDLKIFNLDKKYFV